MITLKPKFPYLAYMNSPWHLYFMAGIYIVAGLMHFIFPRMYLRIIPPYLPVPKLLVFISGVVEVVLGIAICLPETRNLAVFGIILMLTIFLLVHVHMLSDEKASAGLPKWLLVLRIPLQFGLIYWAYQYFLL